MSKFILEPHHEVIQGRLLFLRNIPIKVSPAEHELISSISGCCTEDTTVNDLLKQGLIIQTYDLQINNLGKRLIVAAHSDDAALSLSGTILIDPYDTTILNVFSTCSKSRYYPELLNNWKLISYFNNREEKAFVDLVSAKVKFMNLPEYELRVNGSSSSGLEEYIHKTIKNMIPQFSKVYFPLAIGNHPDHIILNKIGLKLLESGNEIIFYEDQPYATEAGDKLGQDLKEKTQDLSPILINILTELPNKLALCSIYKTQYPERAYLNKTIGSYPFILSTNEKAFERVWIK